MKKGAYVLKSTYRKLEEQNMDLVSDIRVLVSEGPESLIQRIMTTTRWRIEFEERKSLINMIKDYAIKHPLKKQKK